jgi:hypothetical protein
MKDQVPIHTTIDKSTHKKLMELGNGVLKEGIQNCMKIAEGKQGNVKQTLERIANEVLKECAEDGKGVMHGA